jgi:hypothetical protein
LYIGSLSTIENILTDAIIGGHINIVDWFFINYRKHFDSITIHNIFENVKYKSNFNGCVEYDHIEKIIYISKNIM